MGGDTLNLPISFIHTYVYPEERFNKVYVYKGQFSTNYIYVYRDGEKIVEEIYHSYSPGALITQSILQIEQNQLKILSLKKYMISVTGEIREKPWNISIQQLDAFNYHTTEIIENNSKDEIYKLSLSDFFQGTFTDREIKGEGLKLSYKNFILSDSFENGANGEINELYIKNIGLVEESSITDEQWVYNAHLTDILTYEEFLQCFEDSNFVTKETLTTTSNKPNK